MWYGHRNYYEHDDTPADWCPHQINRAYADCGICLAEVAEPDPVDTIEAMLRAFRVALDKIHEVGR